MATKLNWEKQGKIGNVIKSYQCYVIFRGDMCKLGVINVFKSGEYCLPVGMFPRSKKTGMCRTAKSLAKAKSEVQKWWDEFVKVNQ